MIEDPNHEANIKLAQRNGLKPTILGKKRIKKEPKHFLSEVLRKELKDTETSIVVEGEEVGTGRKVKVIVKKPSQHTVVLALLQQANKGNMFAIKEIFDRAEGKTPQQIIPQREDKTKNQPPVQIIFQSAPGCEPIRKEISE